ncbi:LysE family translocator [Rhodococcus sp. BP-252]|uniref:LysE family translocator n=1 Tax=unclassified Rhodococcus (in: high G+C Gram-positive bacteria) TaxID=192944 RepID=UPI001C9B5D83|nr:MULTISPECIES: LysE family translocator [unclassified Rhodococcus (in: high G+C Gram-positive bacteria)]MBY6414760.1 LysE family translocator [Rhodococcus sp. BP-320]MBY6419664.1 LysE family translocator [Rhodococcus sp. BP-321]MBY6424641.1 LysE family translocator [Rhodococcus sp. BP-324]MBY6429638.1 LysE family translocator [Rhodococcus sp. BP-323]MBY6434640.1 LysE family translocator [Rhodococcus sp. BP-322]
MEQFLVVALAHFLALLIPGVDFFLIARTSMASGWRNASGVCVGIAVANGACITAAFTGLSLVTQPMILDATQLLGGVFLTYVGVSFFRARVKVELDDERTGRSSWTRNFGLGLASGLLNPKNVLFYVSLAAALTDASWPALVFYGAWMVSVVLVWDLFVAVALGSARAVTALSRYLPWMTKIAGGFLVALGVGMIVGLVV